MRYFKFQKYNQFNDAYILLFTFLLYCGMLYDISSFLFWIFVFA